MSLTAPAASTTSMLPAAVPGPAVPLAGPPAASASSPGSTTRPAPAEQRELQAHVRQLLRSLSPSSGRLERRRLQRHPYPFPILVLPAEPDGSPLTAPPHWALGKQISVRGLDFIHHELIPHPYVLVQLGNQADSIRVLMQLTWCRFKSQRWYDSGGRFLRIVGA